MRDCLALMFFTWRSKGVEEKTIKELERKTKMEGESYIVNEIGWVRFLLKNQKSAGNQKILL